MRYLLGAAALLSFGLIYLLWRAFTPAGLTAEHALVPLLALFLAALLPCLAHTLEVWERVRTGHRPADPAIANLRREVELLYRAQEEHAERVQLSLHRLEAELSSPGETSSPREPSLEVQKIVPTLTALEETVRQHVAHSTATDDSFRQSLGRLDTSVQKLHQRVEQLELRFPETGAANDVFQQHLDAAPTLPGLSLPEPAPTTPKASPSPLLSRALSSSPTASGHISRMISRGAGKADHDESL